MKNIFKIKDNAYIIHNGEIIQCVVDLVCDRNVYLISVNKDGFFKRNHSMVYKTYEKANINLQLDKYMKIIYCDFDTIYHSFIHSNSINSIIIKLDEDYTIKFIFNITLKMELYINNSLIFFKLNLIPGGTINHTLIYVRKYLHQCLIMYQNLKNDIGKEEWIKYRIYKLATHFEQGKSPFVCIITDENYNILMESCNIYHTDTNQFYHAEMCCIYELLKIKDDLSKCKIYTSCEPCVMCLGAIMWAGIRDITYYFSQNDLWKLTGGKIKPKLMDIVNTARHPEKFKINYIHDKNISNIFENYFKKDKN